VTSEGFTVILNVTARSADAEPGDLKDTLWDKLRDLDGFTVERLEVLP